MLVGASPNRLMGHKFYSHDCYEVIVNTEGEGTAEIGGGPLFSPGTVHVVSPATLHRKTAPCGFRDIYLRKDMFYCTDFIQKRRSRLRNC